MSVQQSTNLQTLEDDRPGHTAYTICPRVAANDDIRCAEWIETDTILSLRECR